MLLPANAARAQQEPLPMEQPSQTSRPGIWSALRGQDLCTCLRRSCGFGRGRGPRSNRVRRRDLVCGPHSEQKMDALPAGLAVPQREPLPMGRPSQTLRPGMWSTLRSKDLYTGLWRSGGFSRSPCPWSHRARPRDLVCGAHSEQKMDAPACGCCAASAGTLAHGATEPDAETWNSVDTPKPRQPVAPPPATSLLMPAKAQLFLLVYSDTPESNCLHIHRRRFCARNP